MWSLISWVLPLCVFFFLFLFRLKLPVTWWAPKRFAARLMCVSSLASAVCISPVFSLQGALATAPLMACVFSGGLHVKRLFVLGCAWSPSGSSVTTDHRFSVYPDVRRTEKKKPGIGRIRVQSRFSLFLTVFQQRLWSGAVCCAYEAFKGRIWRGEMKRSVALPNTCLSAKFVAHFYLVQINKDKFCTWPTCTFFFLLQCFDPWPR